MFYWTNWTKVKDQFEDAEDFVWLCDTMGEMGPERWVYLPSTRTYYFKHERDATLFRLMWSQHA